MSCPPFGICVPVEPLRVRDADTLEVRVAGGSLAWAVRLVDVWAPELRRGDADSRDLAREAKRWLERFVADHADDLRLHVALPTDRNILKALTFDRVVGTLYVGADGDSVNRQLVARGFASSTKGGALGA